MQDLIIVESPTKARTITKLLENKYRVVSSKGHIKDLPKSRLGIEIKVNKFIPHYIIIRGKEKIVRELREEAEKAGNIFIGTDPDREGEAIAKHIAEEIKKDTVKRIRFHEVTKEGIWKALQSPSSIDEDLINAYQARRILDRLVGYLISPVLWKVFNKGLSAGRVQTVALRLIVEREQEIRNFKPQPYWICNIVVEKGEVHFPATLTHLNNQRKERISQEEYAKFKDLIKKGMEVEVLEFEEKEKEFSPPPPYITSTLQQDASVFLGFTPKKTMLIAQRLYEGIEIGEEPVGLITYMRTDSFRIDEKFIQRTREFIRTKFGEAYTPPTPRIYEDKKGAQAAHEAIRPTEVEQEPELIERYLSSDEYKLYSLIYQRFLASQLPNSRYKIRTARIGTQEFQFSAKSAKKIFDGYEKVFKKEKRETDFELPPLSLGEKIKILKVNWEKKFTQSPGRYSEASLIKKLEYYGIGRPSTYAPIISTLFERNYVEKKGKAIYPTELGERVNELLIPRFPNVFNVNFTNEMEQALDCIAEGEKDWNQVVADFYHLFSPLVQKLENEIPKLQKEFTIRLLEKCPRCGGSLIVKWGKFGKFIACSSFPHCRFTKPFPLDTPCPKCGEKVFKFKSRKTKRFYYRCSSPDCDFISQSPSTSEKCPSCNAPMVQKNKKLFCIHCEKYYESQD